ncbi:unnamed protein product [Paramecium octaurelia]|uniref:Uncharacterized protein n=1 Tax=Paramecium octaurelia TaxID=43137 RepID=A0A8S1X834_PAROT|nr:unnamed protein product [Paramecium octaurelia]
MRAQEAQFGNITEKNDSIAPQRSNSIHYSFNQTTKIRNQQCFSSQVISKNDFPFFGEHKRYQTSSKIEWKATLESHLYSVVNFLKMIQTKNEKKFYCQYQLVSHQLIRKQG